METPSRARMYSLALLVDYLELERVVVRLGIHGHILTGSLAAV